MRHRCNIVPAQPQHSTAEPPMPYPATRISCAGWLKPLCTVEQVTGLCRITFVTLQVRRRVLLACQSRALLTLSMSAEPRSFEHAGRAGPSRYLDGAEAAAEYADSVHGGSESDAGPCAHDRAAWPLTCPSCMGQHAGAGPCPCVWLCRAVSMARLGRGPLLVARGAGSGQR